MTEWDFVKLLENYGMDVSKFQAPGELELDYVRGKFILNLPNYNEENDTIAFYSRRENAFFIIRKLHYRFKSKISKISILGEDCPNCDMTTDYQRYEMDDVKGVTDAITYLAKRFKDIRNNIRIKIVKEDF
jgi:hypothetical protein